jgi:hypothetical protein
LKRSRWPAASAVTSKASRFLPPARVSFTPGSRTQTLFFQRRTCVQATRLTVEAEMKNVGATAGDEVSGLYLARPIRPSTRAGLGWLRALSPGSGPDQACRLRSRPADAIAGRSEQGARRDRGRVPHRSLGTPRLGAPRSEVTRSEPPSPPEMRPIWSARRVHRGWHRATRSPATGWSGSPEVHAVDQSTARFPAPIFPCSS